MDNNLFYAHISEDGRKQSVLQHLIGTSDLCAKFAAVFGAEEQGRLIGLAHDIGKYSSDFQHRLLQNGQKVDHSTAGAYECMLRGQMFAALCIAGHHGGIPDLGNETNISSRPTLLGRLNRAGQHFLPDYHSWKKELILPEANMPLRDDSSPTEQDFMVRMLYSCLTDADYLDTEAFSIGKEPDRGSDTTISTLVEKADAYIAKWYPPQNALNEQRCSILTQCINKGIDKNALPGLYSLTVPTGGGKTVASLLFALHHAKTHGMRRIIYVIPYTSIIEQTADIFRSILGNENVLEHHSGVSYDIDSELSVNNQKMAYATENWDMPVIITTAVQFFESIYSNRSSKCRKLHNIANSVIIFDEAQMLPTDCLRPCVSAISQLVSRYGVSAVLCTATQPSLSGLFRTYLPDSSIQELCPVDVYDTSVFQRVQFQIIGKMEWTQVAEKMLKHKQALCVVNTRKGAKKLFELLGTNSGVYHLSTLMVPEHRRNILNEIKARLVQGLPCLVVSTSLIEAGVDIDFPVVFRELAGLDSILQAAGRCNREGKRAVSESRVFIFENSVPLQFEKNAEIAGDILRHYQDIVNQEAIKAYFDKLLFLTGDKAIDRLEIMARIEQGAFEFSGIARDFHLIEDNTKTVYIPWEKGKEYIRRFRTGERGKALFREASQYAVSVYEYDFRRMTDSGDIAPVGDDDLWILQTPDLYHEKSGLELNPTTGKAIII